MIYNEWFRDENLEAPLMLGYKKTDNAGNTEIPNNFNNSANNPESTTDDNEAALYSRKPAKAGKFHDYFTSCLPSPLKSDPVEISLTGDAPVVLGNLIDGKVKPYEQNVRIWLNGKGTAGGNAFNRHTSTGIPGYPVAEIGGAETSEATALS